MFVAIEGVDDTGKSTYVDQLQNTLIIGGKKVIATKEPGGSEFGALIKEIVLNNSHLKLSKYTEALLFAADRVEHIRNVIRNNRKKEDVLLISDRYIYSFIAYQHGLRGIDIDFLLDITVKLIVPDLVFYMYTLQKNILLRDDKITKCIDAERLKNISRSYWYSLTSIKQFESVLYSFPSMSFPIDDDVFLIKQIILAHC